MKSTTTFIALLAAGLLSLNLASQAQATNSPPAAGRNARGRGGDQQLNQLSAQLNLSDDQKTKVRAVLQDQRKKAQQLRANSSGSQKDLRAKRQALMADTNTKLKEILTPDQFKKYEEWRQQQRGNRGAAGARPNRNRTGANTNNAGNTAGNGTANAEAQ